MKPGQVLTAAWDKYVSGRLRTPRDIYRAFFAQKYSQGGAQAHKRFLDAPDPHGIRFDIPQRLSSPAHFHTQSWLNQSEKADWQHCDFRLMRWAAMVVDYGRKHQIPLYIHCAYRDSAEQNRLKAAGNSKAVAGLSAHNIGEAVDIVHGVYHWDLTKEEWLFLYNLGQLALTRLNATLPKERQLTLTWGGHFKSLYDPAHWEIKDFRDRRRPLIDGPALRKTPSAILRDIKF